MYRVSYRMYILQVVSYNLPGLLSGDAAHQEKRWRDPDRSDVRHAQVLSSPLFCLCSLLYKFFDIFYFQFLRGVSLNSPIPSRSSPSIYFGPKSNRLMELGIDSERFVDTEKLCLKPGHLHSYITKAMRQVLPHLQSHRHRLRPRKFEQATAEAHSQLCSSRGKA